MDGDDEELGGEEGLSDDKELGNEEGLGEDEELIPERPSTSYSQAMLSQFRGVVWNIYIHRWVVRGISQGVLKILGRFDDEEVAARAYDKAVIECGQLDELNFDDYQLKR
jgi:hypothetical protein